MLTSSTNSPARTTNPAATESGVRDRESGSGRTPAVVLAVEVAHHHCPAVVLTHGRWSIGSDDSNRIVIDNDTVAPRHAMIIATEHRVVMTSWSRATYVNGERCRESLLCAGDVLTIGTADLRVRAADADELIAHLPAVSLEREHPTVRRPVSAAATLRRIEELDTALSLLDNELGGDDSDSDELDELIGRLENDLADRSNDDADAFVGDAVDEADMFEPIDSQFPAEPYSTPDRAEVAPTAGTAEPDSARSCSLDELLTSVDPAGAAAQSELLDASLAEVEDACESEAEEYARLVGTTSVLAQNLTLNALRSRAEAIRQLDELILTAGGFAGALTGPTSTETRTSGPGVPTGAASSGASDDGADPSAFGGEDRVSADEPQVNDSPSDDQSDETDALAAEADDEWAATDASVVEDSLEDVGTDEQAADERDTVEFSAIDTVDSAGSLLSSLFRAEEAADAEAVETEAVETEAVETEAVETEAVETEAANTQAAETEFVETETAATVSESEAGDALEADAEWTVETDDTVDADGDAGTVNRDTLPFADADAEQEDAATLTAISARSDISRSDISRSDISGSDISGSDISGSDISGSDISGSDADFSTEEATLEDATFSADLDPSAADATAAEQAVDHPAKAKPASGGLAALFGIASPREAEQDTIDRVDAISDAATDKDDASGEQAVTDVRSRLAEMFDIPSLGTAQSADDDECAGSAGDDWDSVTDEVPEPVGHESELIDETESAETPPTAAPAALSSWLDGMKRAGAPQSDADTETPADDDDVFDQAAALAQEAEPEVAASPTATARAADESAFAGDDDDPVAAYMKQLLARNRAQHGLPENPDDYVVLPAASASAFAGKAPAQEMAEGNAVEFEPEAEDEVPPEGLVRNWLAQEPKHQLDKDRVRAETKTLRELANQSARSAVTTATRKQLKIQVAAKAAAAVVMLGCGVVAMKLGVSMIVATLMAGAGAWFALDLGLTIVRNWKILKP